MLNTMFFKRKNIEMKPTVMMLVALFVFLQYKIWFEDAGVRDVLKLKSTLSSMEAKHRKLVMRNQRMKQNIEALKEDKNAIETYAREELGMVRQGESYYQIIEH